MEQEIIWASPGRTRVLERFAGAVNAHVDSCAISLLALHPFNVDDVFLSIHLDYLANLLTFVVSSNHLDLVVLADGHGADVVLLSQLLGEWRRHDFPAHVGGGIEMTFAVFAAVGGHEGVELHRVRRATAEFRRCARDRKSVV